jgi:enhancer of polycomb-like protein
VGSKGSEKAFIPTPITTELSPLDYEKLYPKRFEQPSSYIKSSATVEDCSGSMYCMSEVDEKYLTTLNSTRASTLPRITEDEFEGIMDIFEGTIQHSRCVSCPDGTKIPAFQEMERAIEDKLDANAKGVAKVVYSYWKEKIVVRGGRPILGALRVSSFPSCLELSLLIATQIEEGNDEEDSDPYVCFRQREEDQMRKTRRTDAQNIHKLLGLRNDLEFARGQLKDLLQREKTQHSSLVAEQQDFEQRYASAQLMPTKGTEKDSIYEVRFLLRDSWHFF